MSTPNWTDMLERAADRRTVGPPPIEALRAGARRRRRRRTTVSAALAASAVVVGAATLLTTLLTTGLTTGPDGAEQGPATNQAMDPVTDPGAELAPPGTRLVGLGHAAVAVPEQWGTNDTRCGTPERDTVVIDVGAVNLCLAPRPEGVESVELGRGEPFVATEAAPQPTIVDGEPARRWSTTCEPASRFDPGTCTGLLQLTGSGVWFRAESSTGPAEVDFLLDAVRVLPSAVGVPGHQQLLIDSEDDTGARYLDLLAAEGLTAEVVTRSAPGVQPSRVLKVSPRPGTMLAVGSTVTVTLVATPVAY